MDTEIKPHDICEHIRVEKMIAPTLDIMVCGKTTPCDYQMPLKDNYACGKFYLEQKDDSIITLSQH